MPARSPARSQLPFCFDEEPEVMNTPAEIIPMVESAAPMPMLSQFIGLPDAPATMPLCATGTPRYGSTAALMKRHAAKQAQGLAAPTKPFKPGRDAQDTPLSVLAYAMREVPPDKLLQQAQDAGDFPAACRRLRQACSRWAKDIVDEVAEAKRELTVGERQGVAFWEGEARDAETALRIWEAVQGNVPAAVNALQDADLQRYADALRTGCFLSLGL